MSDPHHVHERGSTGRAWWGERRVSIRAPRAGGDVTGNLARVRLEVSIRAPRAGGDRWSTGWGLRSPGFNPRPPCGGRPRSSRNPGRDWKWFQSAPPVRGATSPRPVSTTPSSRFNPRPPCGGRLRERSDVRAQREFQSAPPVRGATLEFGEDGDQYLFQSAPPVRGATETWSCGRRKSLCFNPRPPCGGRLRTSSPCRAPPRSFNPRPPCGGRLPMRLRGPASSTVSIRAPRAGGDRC